MPDAISKPPVVKHPIAPIVSADRNPGTGQVEFTVRCPHCGARHTHGGTIGQRRAPCSRRERGDLSYLIAWPTQRGAE